jgi:hypothetical protein
MLFQHNSARLLATHSIRIFRPSLHLPCVTVCHQVPNALYLRHVRPSVRSHVSALLPFDGFPWNLISVTSMLICGEIPDLVKIGQQCQFTWRCYIVVGDVSRYHSTILHWNGARLFVHFLSVRLLISVRFVGEEFKWNFIMGTFMKLCQEIQNLVKSGINMGQCTRRPKYFLLLQRHEFASELVSSC